MIDIAGVVEGTGCSFKLMEHLPEKKAETKIMHARYFVFRMETSVNFFYFHGLIA